MSKVRRPSSPARSQGSVPIARAPKSRRTRSVGSNASGRLETLIQEYKESNMGSFVLSPLRRASILTDNTDIEEPRRKSWWNKLDENTRDVMEILEDNKTVEPNNIMEELDIEVLSQEKKNYTLDLPESSDSESINSIVLPQRKLFTEKQKQPKTKFSHFGKNDMISKHDQNTNATAVDKTVEPATRELFHNRPRSKPIFPATLLNMSPDKTTDDKTLKAVESKGHVHNIFGNRQGTKRKNMFANFLVSESDDEIPEIQAKVFGFNKNSSKRRPSSQSVRDSSIHTDITTDMELDDWKLLPSSTMVENQLEAVVGHTPKRARLSELIETKESSEGQEELSKSVEKQTEYLEERHESLEKRNESVKLRDKSQKKLSKSVELQNDQNAEHNDNEKECNSSQVLSTHMEVQNESNEEQSQCQERDIESQEEQDESHETHDENGEDQKETKEIQSDSEEEHTRNQKLIYESEEELEQNECQEELNESVKLQDKSQKKLSTTTELQNDGNATQTDGQKEFNGSQQAVNTHMNVQNESNEEQRECQVKDNESQEIQNESKEEHTQNKNLLVESEEELKRNESRKELNESVKLQDKSQKKPSTIMELQNDGQKEFNRSQEQLNTHLEVQNQSDKEQKECQEKSNEIQEQDESKAVDESQEIQNESEEEHTQSKKLQEEIEEELEQSESREELNESVKLLDESKKKLSKGVASQNDRNAEENYGQKEFGSQDQNTQMEVQNISINKQSECHEKPNDSQEEQDKSQAVDERHAVHDDNGSEEEHTQSQEIQDKSEEEINEGQEVQDDSQEVQNESQEVQGESQEVQDESQEMQDESQEVQDESQEVQDESQEVQDESQEVQDESQEVQDESQEMLDESQEMQDESQEIENESEEESEAEKEIDESNESLEAEDEMDDQQNISEEQLESENEDDNGTATDQDENDDDEVESDENKNEENEASNTEIPNISHDTTGRNRKKNESPEAIVRRNSSNLEDSFVVKGRNTSIRKTKTMIQNHDLIPILATNRTSMGLSDGTRNSSAEGSGWDSHRTTRKTLRQTFGRDFTPRKSLRALVMEKSAKRQTLASDLTSVMAKFPQANSTELPDYSAREDVENLDPQESDHEVSLRTRQTTLEMYLQKVKKQNMENRARMEELVKKSLQQPTTFNNFKVPATPLFPRRPIAKAAKSKSKPKSLIPIEELPEEIIQDMKYKPPKRFQPSNASWITKRLYKHLETKLENKYDYKARIRSEKLVERLYQFVKDLRRFDAAPTDAVDVLKHEMARLDIVKTHYDFYEFFHQFMPREVRIKVIPDVANKIPQPRNGAFAPILNR